MIQQDRTIAAISTPHGKGGIAVVRISGDKTAEILGRVFRPSGRIHPIDAPRTAVYGSIVTAASTASTASAASLAADSSSATEWNTVDTGVATFYKAPASFTGEDTAELSCHGGILVTGCVLEAVLAAGAVPAEAGEFTHRAFLNGKLTLSEAEAVGLLLDADTHSKMKLASSGIRGVLSDRLSEIADKVSAVLSNLFALIDYPDEDIDEIGSERLRSELLTAADEASGLAATFRTGRAVAEGVQTLICGKPNVGKSSLYNAIARDDRAIVTSVAGTTRDVLEDTVDLGGITLRIWDTAGIRSTSDEVEAIGVDRALRRMDEAELILAVYDGSRGLDDGDLRLIDEIEKRASGRDVCTVAVVNKSDMGVALSERELALLRDRHRAVVTVSAATGDGMEELGRTVSELYGLGELTVGTDAVIWDAARRAELELAASLLREAAAELENGAPEDAVCSDAELALASLRRTDGRGVSEEIVNGIFSRFCVGK